MLLLLAALGALIGSRPALAQGDAARAKREYTLGYRALQAGDFARALGHYERSFALSPRPRTLFNMALCEAHLGRDEAAYHHFVEFVASAEERDAPYLAQARERISALEKRLTGRVTIQSDPPGARVRIDGSRKVHGRTPLTVELTPGEHYLHLTAPGATPVERVVAVPPRSRQVVRVALPLSAAIVLRTEPADAIIERVGDAATARGTYRARVRPGTYEFVVTRPGYATERVEVRAPSAGTFEHRVRLRPQVTTATLIVATAGGAVSVDGVATPAIEQGKPVRSGQHLVRVERPGHEPWQDRIHLSPGEIVTVDVELARPRGSRWVRWAGLGLGVAGIAAGGAFGVGAIRDVTDPAGDHGRGKSRALVADGLIVVGAAVAVAAWYFTRDASPRVDVRRHHGGP